jgi:hypothetical protein
MKILYALFAAAVVVVGLLHMATTFRLSASAAGKVWFFGAGIALVLAGVLNFLNLRYGFIAFGLRVACIATNLFMLGFAVVAGSITRASTAELIGLLGVLGLTLVLSALRSASAGEKIEKT